MYQRWTDNEIQIARKHCKEGIERLKQVLPNRTEGAIRNKCNQLNLDIPWKFTNTTVIERLFRVVL